ncbi:MAG: hypothetical protein ABJX32_00855 [Tateyamaria sp.]|uniref:hypothetical protein n=1 Tax=Tateyamaria sp. TaxID=1929288 RepID=UPI0032A05138
MRSDRFGLSDNEIGNLQADKITAAQPAVDRKFEQSQIQKISGEFEPGADGSDLLWQQRALLTNQLFLVPGYVLWSHSGELDFGLEFSSIRPSHSWRQHCVDWVNLRHETPLAGWRSKLLKE